MQATTVATLTLQISPTATLVVHPVSVVSTLYCADERVAGSEALILLPLVGTVAFVFHTSTVIEHVEPAVEAVPVVATL
jgi:hypothetical protein